MKKKPTPPHRKKLLDELAKIAQELGEYDPPKNEKPLDKKQGAG